MPSHKRTASGQEACLFCRSNEDRPELFGDLLTDAGGSVRLHNFCMLFACALKQRGQEGEGIHGFLVEDIRREAARGAKLKCSYCRRPGATIGCSEESCQVKFHFHCGLARGTQHKFYDKFTSFCPAHRQRQTFRKAGAEPELCMICMDADEPIRVRRGRDRLFNEPLDVIMCPGCKHLGHRVCTQRQALAAGKKTFKCANCRESSNYGYAVRKYGVYLPIKDADWEIENAFADQYQAHHACRAESCLCPEGREHHVARTQWDIVNCRFCGGLPQHARCGGIAIDDIGDWACGTCRPVHDRQSLRAALRNHAPPPDDEPMASASCDSPEEPQQPDTVIEEAPEPKKRPRTKAGGSMMKYVRRAKRDAPTEHVILSSDSDLEVVEEAPCKKRSRVSLVISVD